VSKPGPVRGRGRGDKNNGKKREWRCKWEECGILFEDQKELVQHLHSGECEGQYDDVAVEA
jgi:hypothetical protein